jgi:hypothetical protein
VLYSRHRRTVTGWLAVDDDKLLCVLVKLYSARGGEHCEVNSIIASWSVHHSLCYRLTSNAILQVDECVSDEQNNKHDW